MEKKQPTVSIFPSQTNEYEDKYEEQTTSSIY